MKKRKTNYHSCYDKILSTLFTMTDIENCERVKLMDEGKDYLVCLTSSKDNVGSNINAHEIIIYILLLHKCIMSQNETETISYKEIQLLRGKRVGKSQILDNKTLKAYDNSFSGMANKRIHYKLLNLKHRRIITYNAYSHPLLIISNVQVMPNRDKIIKYSLGPFGKMLIEAKNYSTLVPSKYFKINFNQIVQLQVALYVCKILYLERRKKKQNITITLNSIMNNINRFVDSSKYGLVKTCKAIDYVGTNVGRLWNYVINTTNDLLNTLKQECTIKDYYSNYNSSILSKDDYQNTKWIISK